MDFLIIMICELQRSFLNQVFMHQKIYLSCFLFLTFMAQGQKSRDMLLIRSNTEYISYRENGELKKMFGKSHLI